MAEYYRCHICHGRMNPCVVTRTFTRQDRDSKVITTKTMDVTEFICENCGEGIYESDEAKRIENALYNPAV